MTEQQMQMKLISQQEKINELRQEVAAMNKDREYWQHYRIQAAIAAMQGLVSNEIHLHHADKVAEEKDINTSTFLAKCAIDIADALIEELKKGGEQ